MDISTDSTGNHTMAGAHSLSMLVTDPVKKCQHYENGDCVPQFDTEYTSIVTEVGACVFLSK